MRQFQPVASVKSSILTADAPSRHRSTRRTPRSSAECAAARASCARGHPRDHAGRLRSRCAAGAGAGAYSPRWRSRARAAPARASTMVSNTRTARLHTLPISSSSNPVRPSELGRTYREHAALLHQQRIEVVDQLDRGVSIASAARKRIRLGTNRHTGSAALVRAMPSTAAARS